MKKIMLLLFVVLTILFSGSLSWAAPKSVAYQINKEHTGFINMTAFGPQLIKRWAVDLGNAISYPLIAEGKVFVTVKSSSGYGTNLYALDAVDGSVIWGPMNLGGIYYWSGCCYESGRVFALNGSGLMKAFDAGTGQTIWSKQLPGQYMFSSAPTAYNGVVYTGGAGSGGTVYAVRSSDGLVLWTAPVANGDYSSPAVSDDGVYVSYACAMSYKFNPQNGSRMWLFQTGCSGGGGTTPTLYNNKLYVRDYSVDYILNASTGANSGNFYSRNVPAFSNNIGIFLDAASSLGSKGPLKAYDVNSNVLLWIFYGDNNLWSAPVIINNYVYVGSSNGNLYAVDLNTGSQAWSTNVGSGISYIDEHNVSQPLTGFGAGEGILVIPAGSKLVAYEAADTAPPTLSWGTPSPAPNSAGWNNTPVQVPFTTADDGSGVESVSATSPLTFISEGANLTQDVTVTDRAGNSASFSSEKINIDFTAPVTEVAIDGIQGANGWYKSPVAVELKATDGLSGVRQTLYSINSGSTVSYNGLPLSFDEGVYNLNYYSIDNALNQAKPASRIIKIDRTPPSLSINSKEFSLKKGTAIFKFSPELLKRKKGVVDVSGNTNDLVSGISDVSFTIYKDDNSVYQTGNVTVSQDGNFNFNINVPNKGKYALKVTTTDNAGNSSIVSAIIY